MGRIVRLFLLAFLLNACTVEQNPELVGTVERTAIELAAPVSEVISDLPFRVGERVEAGDIVVQLDHEIAAAELEAARAALQAAEATLAAAEAEFERFTGLRKKRAASETQLDEAQRVRDEAVAQVAERRARVAVADKRLRDLSIVSPVFGRIDQRPFELGERVPAGVVVAVVVSDEAPWVRVWLPSRWVARIGDKRAVRVRVEGYEQVFKGQVRDVAFEPEFTPHFALTERESAHLVYRARVSLDNAPADLRPGLAARVSLDVVR
jgi:HlyD family secretion protein